MISTQINQSPIEVRHIKHNAPVLHKGGATTPAHTSDKVTRSAHPYGTDYAGTVTVKPEVWSKIRGAEDGKPVRNDHLAGILQNLGFSQSEIYGKSPNGEPLLKRIAEINGLRHPDLIHPSDNLVLPTHLSPEEMKKRLAGAKAATKDPALQAEISRLQDQQDMQISERIEAPLLSKQDLHQSPVAEAGRDATAEARILADSIDHSKITQTPTANAGRDAAAEARILEHSIDHSKITQTPTTTAGRDATAEARIQADSIDNSKITQTPTATAGRDATAEARIQAGTIDNSKITQTPTATAGRDATAEARIQAGTIDHSKITQTPTATAGRDATAEARIQAGTIDQAKITQTPTATAGRDATAEARIQADSIDNSKITQTPTANAGRDGDAKAQVEAGTIDNSQITQSPTAANDGTAQARVQAQTVKDTLIAQTPTGQALADVKAAQTAGAVKIDQNATGPTAQTQVQVGANSGTLQIKSQASGQSVDQTVRLANNSGQADIQLQAQGPGTQTVKTDTGAIKVDEKLTTTSQGSGTQSVTAQDPTSITPYWDRPRQQFAPGQASLTSQGLGNSNESVRGVASASLRADGTSQTARLTSDAPDANYSGTGNPTITVEHRGHSGTASADLQAKNSIRFSDEGAGPNQGSRNDVDLKLSAPRVSIGATTSGHLKAQTTGTAGDDVHDVMLPSRDANPVVESNLGAGNDRLAVQGNSNGATVVVAKTEGSLQLDLNLPAARGKTQTLLDLGKATLKGSLETGFSAQQNTVMIETQGAKQDATISAANNPGDLLVVDSQNGGHLPRVIYQEARSGFLGIGKRQEEALTPPGWQPDDGVIHAQGFPNILLRDGSKPVGSRGQVTDVPSFEAARQAALKPEA